jgi:KUP system potassium uptake protein
MYGWYFGRKLKNRYVTFVRLDKYIELFKSLVQDKSLPKKATNVVYIIKANMPDQVESKVIHSIFQKQPKRANTYWFIHVDRTDEPHTYNYRVTHIIPEVLIRVDFYLGFKIVPKINLYFKEVLEDLAESSEIKLESSYDSLRKRSFPPDFIFILIDRVMTQDYRLSTPDNITLALHNISRLICISDVKTLQLDETNTVEEKVPISIDQPLTKRISRMLQGN